MWEIINWPNILTVILFLVGFGGGVMNIVGTTSPDFLIARICFSAAAFILLMRASVSIIYWQSPMGRKVIITFLIFGMIGAFWAVMLGWVDSKEKVFLLAKKTEKEKEAKSAYAGILQTDKKASLPQTKHPSLVFGDSNSGMVFAGGTVHIGEDRLIVEIEDGQLKLSAIIRDKNGDILAEIAKNNWIVSPPPNILDRNYSKNALEVRARDGDIILQVKLLDDLVQFQAKLYTADGIMVIYGKSPPPKKGGFMATIPPNHPRPTFKIKPMFKYPSELHFGEFVEDK